MENTEGSEGTGTKISDSAYSNSCGNSQSHRSGSSKSRHSGSNSSGSSGYGGKGSSSATNSNGAAESLMSKRTKDKKCKKSKSGSVVKNTTELSSSIRNTENDDRTSNIENNTTCMNRVDNITDSQIDEINVNCSLKSVDNGSSLILAQQHGTHSADHSLLNPKQERDSSSIDALSPAKIDEHMSVCARSQCTSNSRNIQQLPTHLEGFSCIVSLREGVVLYTNNSITHALGYPQDMWLGRSFIDFIHPKDQPLFGSQITSGVASTFVETSAAKNSEVLPRATLYCRIRRYRGIKSSNGGSSGYGVRDKDVSYAPFQLNLSFRDAAEFDDPNFYLIIKALPVISPYADGNLKSKKFTTRHTATGLITHIDPVSLIGYLPQDVVGKNIFDFYHPEDMPYLKEVYENVLRTEKTFRSKPYRFCTQNGDYLTVESDWSIFINPWSRKMEFVICCHYILQAPNNTDVFQLRTKQVKMFSNDVLKRSKIFQEEIIQLLTGKKSECTKMNTIHQTKNMTMFIEKLLNEFQRPKNELEVEVPEDTSLSERDSVMLGEISPHHDYFDSKASIETSPSYNQLNYNENLQRFFESKPYTTINSDLIAEDQPIEDNSDTNVFSTRRQHGKSHRRNSCSGDSRSSDISDNVYPSTSKCPTMSQPNVDGYKAAYLTEEVLHKHNIVMEKLLIKKHRDERFLFKAEEHEVGNKKDKKKFNTRHLSAFNQVLKNKNGFLQGIKRSGSTSWEQQNDTHKVSKLAMHNPNDYTNVNKVPAAQCYTMMNNNPMPSAPAHNMPTVINNNPQGYMLNSNQVPASPPHMSTMNPNDNRQNPYSNVYPAVYLISPQPDHSHEPNNFSTSNKFPVPYMMYPPPMFTSQPFLYPHMAMAYQPVPLTDPPTQTPVTHDNDSSSIPSIGLPFNNYQQACQVSISTGRPNRAALRNHINKLNIQSCNEQLEFTDTSTVVQRGSLTSQSVLKRSKFSRNRNVDTKSREDFDNDESSYSSFYSSFLKTETSNSTDIDSGGEPGNTSSVKDNSNDSKYYVPMDNYNSKDGRSEGRNCFPNRFGSCSQTSNFRNPEAATRSEKFKRNHKPPWLDNVIVTPDLVYRYQIPSHNIGDVLKSDLLFLKTTCQPSLVNQQLSQLYLDMELDGLSQKLTLEEGFTSNSSSEDDNSTASEKKSRYSKLVMIYEEDAPIPPPVFE